MRHRRTALALAVASSLLLAACGSSGTKGSGDSGTNGSGGGSGHPSPAAAHAPLHAMLPASVQKAGVLTVATDASYPPFEFYASDNKTIVGADPDFARALGNLLGVRFELRNTGFDGIVAGIAAQKFQLAMSGMADTRDRQKQISFVDYANNGDAFIASKGDAKNYPTWTSLCGHNVAIQTGTDTVADLQAQSKKCTHNGKRAITISDYGTQDQGVLAVTSGRSVVLVSSGGSAGYIAAQSHGQLASIVPPDNPPGSTGALGIALAKDQTALAKALLAAVTALIKDGTYAKIMNKWGLTQCCAIKTSAINGGT